MYTVYGVNPVRVYDVVVCGALTSAFAPLLTSVYVSIVTLSLMLSGGAHVRVTERKSEPPTAGAMTPSGAAGGVRNHDAGEVTLPTWLKHVTVKLCAVYGAACMV